MDPTISISQRRDLQEEMLPKNIPKVPSFSPEPVKTILAEYASRRPMCTFAESALSTPSSVTEPDELVKPSENSDCYLMEYHKQPMAITMYLGGDPGEEDVAVEVDPLVSHPHVQWKMGLVYNTRTKVLTGVVTKQGKTLEDLLPKQQEHAEHRRERERGILPRILLNIVGRRMSMEQVVQQAVEREKLQWCRELTEALGFLHEMKMIHRDVSPKTCLIDEATRTMKLADFGSPRVEDGIRMPFYRRGSIVYSPLEVIEFDDFSYKSDVYSLAVTLYFIITDRPPFNADKWRSMTLDDVCADIRDGNRSRFGGTNSELGALLTMSIKDEAEDRPMLQELLERIRTENVVEVMNSMVAFSTP